MYSYRGQERISRLQLNPGTRPSCERFTRDVFILMIGAESRVKNSKNEGPLHSVVCLSKKIINSGAVKGKQQVEAQWLVFFFSVWTCSRGKTLWGFWRLAGETVRFHFVLEVKQKERESERVYPFFWCEEEVRVKGIKTKNQNSIIRFILIFMQFN